jgi:endonuclease III related protein
MFYKLLLTFLPKIYKFQWCLSRYSDCVGASGVPKMVMTKKGNMIQSPAQKLAEFYSELLGAYGSQGWWPVTPKGGVIPEYGVPRHDGKQKLEIIFSTILAQNTRWKPNVERAIIEMNKKGLIDADKILDVKHEELAAAIRSAGYYNQKAKKLKNVASFLKQYPLKDLEKMGLRKARELLLSVNGIGPETADSILLYALEKPIFVVDAYTRRIFSGLGMIKEGAGYDEVQRLFMENLEHDAKMFNEYHALIVEHAKGQSLLRKDVSRRMD